MTNESELKEIAAQLACPSGDMGIAVGEKMNETNANIIARSIDALAPKAGERIVEIGPGNGVLSLPIVEAIGAAGHYIGLERSVDMAKQTLHFMKLNQSAKIDILTGDCLQAAIAKHSIDGLMAVNLLYFIDDLDAFFIKISSWLKPGARIVFGVRSPSTLAALPFAKFGFHFRSPEEIAEKLSANGFTQVQSQYFAESETRGENKIPMDFLTIKAMAGSIAGVRNNE